MRRRRINGDTWVDVYREGTFSGRIYRLGPGEKTRMDKVGSMIVGPRAMVRIVSRSGREILQLPPRKVVTDVSKLPEVKPHSYLRVVTKRSAERRMALT